MGRGGGDAKDDTCMSFDRFQDNNLSSSTLRAQLSHPFVFKKDRPFFFSSQNPCPNPTFPNFCYRICQHLQSVCRLLTTFISSSMLDTQLGQRHDDEGWEGGGSPVLATTTPATTYRTSMADLPTPPPIEKFKINNSQLQNTCLHLFK